MFDDPEPPAAREGVSATAGRGPPAAAAIDPADYDVGPDCPRDELYARLNAARSARARADPVADMTHRCRLCSANDLDALRDELAEKMWRCHRGAFVRECTFDQIGPYWLMVYRGLADDAINLLRHM